jgi:hypothetical protein
MSQAAFAFITLDAEDTRRAREGAWNVPGPDAVFEIYLITNILNDKKYVGQAWYGAKRRWREHKRLANSGKPEIGLRGAIQKYGVDAFTFQVIDTARDEHELDALEIKWIAHYGTYAPDGSGYNLTEGGGGCRKWKPTAENLANITAANRKMHADPAWQAAIVEAAAKRSSDPEYLEIIRQVGLNRIAESDASDPDGAAQRAIYRANTALHRARKKGLGTPKLTPEERMAAYDAAHPEDLEKRNKARGWVKQSKANKAERTALGLSDDPIVARDILDPERIEKRKYGRENAAYYAALKRGEINPRPSRREKADAHNTARDAEDPDGARDRALKRAAKARCKARAKGEEIPDLRKAFGQKTISQYDAIDPEGAGRRAKNRAKSARHKARKMGTAALDYETTTSSD